MNFIKHDKLVQRFTGKRVVIIGSAPSCLDNKGADIDKYDVIIRVNNYKMHGFKHLVGSRTDVHYSFYGNSIKKSNTELAEDGVTLCMCKCPNTKIMHSPWHQRNNKVRGVDFRYIYQMRHKFWFCDTYIPTLEQFNVGFETLGKHIPTTGFSCIFDLAPLDCELYLTGFDFFSSNMHNVNEAWRPGDPTDPIGHSPERERAWLRANKSRFQLDRTLDALLV